MAGFMGKMWPIFVLVVYIVMNAKNVLTSVKLGRVSVKSLLILLILIVSLIVILKIPSIFRAYWGCRIVAVYGVVFSIIDIWFLVKKSYFNSLSIFDFIVAIGSCAGALLTKLV